MTTQWTESAQHHLDSYLKKTQACLGNSGADASEVVDDLRRHIEEELAAARIKIVTEHDLKRVLARLGNTEPVAEPAPAPREIDETPQPAPRVRRGRSLWLLFLGVILPALTIGIEMFTHMCAEVFFDPIPTVWHLLMAISVPAINLALWWKESQTGEPLRYMGLFSGFAIGIAAYFSLLYLPLLPLALIAIVFLGWGLLPIAPLFSLAAAIRLSKVAGQRRNRAQMAGGLAVAVAALAVVVLPAPLTRYWSARATDGTQEQRTRAIRLLRTFGHNNTLLRDCYGSTAWTRDNDFFALLGQPVDVNRAREVYFRVTGKVFNAEPAPQRKLKGRGWEGMNDFTWDEEHGGEAVGGRVSGLSITQSRMDGLVNADQGWSYFEWILEFKNVAGVDREARAQIRLPAGGVVSRLTLWVNGEEREAAFAGRAQVREAYRSVAVVQRRDPVLVTSCGPDTVLTQCFPVPRDGGSMKVRLGITAPTTLLQDKDALVQAPQFIERNFSMPSDFAHSLWIESHQVLQAADTSLSRASSNRRFGLRGAPTEQELQRGIRIHAQSSKSSYWTRDYGSAETAFIRQRFAKVTEPPPQRLIILLDGSVGMRDFYPEIAEVLPNLPEGTEVAILAAKDGVVEVGPQFSKWNKDLYSTLAQRVRRFQAAGGQDNMAALMRAWDLAAESPNGAVLWIHGPQPVLVDPPDAIEQRLLWSAGSFAKAKPRLYHLQTKPGPHRILEKLDGVDLLRPVCRTAGVQADLLRLFEQWKGKSDQYEPVYDRVAAIDEADGGKEGSKHIVRLWAFNEIRRLKAASKVKEAIALAGTYQLVTPVSGAVVLETMAQFTAAGLTPVDAASVPMVPEPKGILAIGLLLVAVVMAYRRRVARKRELTALKT